MRIGIVGGSIAGCTAAVLLRKAGYEVSVFERSTKTLVGRGGGIGTTAELMAQLRADELIEADFPFFKISNMPFVGKNSEAEPFGRIAWAMPMNFQVFHWNALWESLRRKVPDKNYHSGVEITKAQMTDKEQVVLTTRKGEKQVFDLVLFADGYRSLGRSLLFPQASLKYRGYVLWRGLLPESSMPARCPLGDAILRLSYPEVAGHNVLYYIPNQQGSTDTGKRIFNWAAYIAVPPDELDELMTDRTGKLREGTLPPGTMNPKNENKLKEFLAAHLPEYYGQIVHKTENSYVQVIYTLDLEAYYKHRIGLIGDAGIVIQPFTGSGVFKGYHNVKGLIHALQTHHSVETALAHWNEKQLRDAKGILALGEQMEEAFIWNQPDFSHLTSQAVADWWKASVKFPEHFRH